MYPVMSHDPRTGKMHLVGNMLHNKILYNMLYNRVLCNMLCNTLRNMLPTKCILPVLGSCYITGYITEKGVIQQQNNAV